LLLVAGGLLFVAAVLFANAGGLLRYTVTRDAVRAQSTPLPTSAPPAALVTAADYLAQGDYDFDQGDYSRAITDYSRAIALNPALAEAYNNRAYAYMTLGQYALALPDLDQAIRLRPDYVNALMNRGDIHNYYYDVDYASAVRDYDRVLAIDPSAAYRTSVCGHRMLAAHHGWNLAVVADLLSGRAVHACADANLAP
jgi:tetratricopeptide (TPR) repeat protein